MGLNILHLFAMIRNNSMTLTMVGSDEHMWITYFDEYSSRKGVVFVGKEGSVCW